MKAITLGIILILLSTSIFAGFGRSGGGGASRSSFSSSRSYSSARFYSAPRSYSAPHSYASRSTVVNNYHGSSGGHSGGGFGSSFLGSMTGSMIGNSLSQPHATTVIQQPAVVAAAPAIAAQQPYYDSQPQLQQVVGAPPLVNWPGIILSILLILGLGWLIIAWMIKHD